jgi:transcription elongation factor GreA-like protein
LVLRLWRCVQNVRVDFEMLALFREGRRVQDIAVGFEMSPLVGFQMSLLVGFETLALRSRVGFDFGMLALVSRGRGWVLRCWH